MFTIDLQTTEDVSENDSMQFNKNVSAFRNFHRIILLEHGDNVNFCCLSKNYNVSAPLYFRCIEFVNVLKRCSLIGKCIVFFLMFGISLKAAKSYF